MVDLAAIIIAVAFVVLVGYLVPMILQVKRTVGQSERLLIRLNHELPGLLKDVKGTNENILALTDQARVGMDRATIFLNAVGDVGETVNHVHQTVRGKGGALAVGFTSLLAGLKAATSTVRKRVHKEQEGGPSYGN
ncbi:MAG TPA: DUF948 domain-containing protein [Nitrospirales bacterium]|nr:hypothetical protein [Nitrospiraceae bacterium]HNP29547.1 DUF948 domain-containing protein [Nitrospirales bacterium]